MSELIIDSKKYDDHHYLDYCDPEDKSMVNKLFDIYWRGETCNVDKKYSVAMRGSC